MTTEELVKAIDRLSERVAIQEMTLSVIKEAADRLEQKLSLVMEEQRTEPYVINVSDADAEKIKKWITK
jgi:hypothetical protein